MVNGRFTMDEGTATGARPGEVLDRRNRQEEQEMFGTREDRSGAAAKPATGWWKGVGTARAATASLCRRIGTARAAAVAGKRIGAARATAVAGRRIGAARAAAVAVAAAAGAAATLAATPADGAALQSSPPRFGAVQSSGEPARTKGEFGFFGALALPVDEFRSNVDVGGGGGLAGVWLLDDAGMIGVRADGAFLLYGYRSEQRPFSVTVPEVSVDVRTSNFIVSGGIGPQVYLATGTVRPYVYGTVGVSYFATETTVAGTHRNEDIASTTNLHDTSLALTGGGGFSIRLSRGVNPVSLELGASYQYNGETEYLTSSPTVTEYRRGGSRFTPITSETNMVIFRAGVALGMR